MSSLMIPFGSDRRVASEEDLQKLRDLFERKLRKVPSKLRLPITIEDILDNAVGDCYPYEDFIAGQDDGTVSVYFGGTLAAILRYRGEIQTNIKEDIPIHRWKSPVILSWFCSNVNKYYSFNLYHEETRARLYVATLAETKNKATRLQLAYILACLEEIQYPGAYDAALPTSRRFSFILEYIMSPQDFLIYTDSQNDRVRKSSFTALKSMEHEWQDMVTAYSGNKVVLEGMATVSALLIHKDDDKGYHGDDDTPAPPAEKKKKRKQKSTKKREQELRKIKSNERRLQEAAEDVSKSTMNLTDKEIHIEISKFRPVMRKNKLLFGLLQPYPQLYTSDVVAIDFSSDDKVDADILELSDGFGRLSIEAMSGKLGSEMRGADHEGMVIYETWGVDEDSDDDYMQGVVLPPGGVDFSGDCVMGEQAF